MQPFQPWSLVLHIYQPPNQRPETLDLVSREGYLGLLEALLSTSYPVSLNVSGVLLEQLAKQQPAILDLIKNLATKDNITFLNSAYTHALLPLWPQAEGEYQLAHNRLVVAEYLGKKLKLTGLYLPECAYAPTLDGLIKKDRVAYTVIDEISLRSATYHPLVRAERGGPVLVVRNRALSQALATSVEQTAAILDKTTTPLVAVLDGEVFGHFDANALERLKSIFSQFGNRMQSTKLLATGKPVKVKVRAASWETDPSDLLWRRPFPLWQDNKNRVHQAMWHFIKGVQQALYQTDSLLQNGWERLHFSNAMASCWWWWANPKRTAGPFKMKVWNPDLVVEGMSEAIKAIRTDPNIPRKTKWHLETEYADLLKLIWQTHWKLGS
ncbi:MAG: hypothetical protein Q7S64_03360 [bacterium]|nr:hypothetical protein [bacterium]